MGPVSKVFFFFFLSGLNLIGVTGHYPSFAYQSTVVHPAPLWHVYTCPVCPAPPPPPPTPDPEVEQVLEYTKKISDTVCQVGSTLTEIGAIALEDNPEVGAEIVKKLQDQVSKGSQAMSEFTTNTGAHPDKTGRRVKRAAKVEGAAALDKVGDALIKASDAIGLDTKKLSKKAQAKINKKHQDGLDKCRADSCKAASKLLASADDADDERQ